MNTIALQDLTDKPNDSDLVIEALEGGIYLAYAIIDGVRTPIVDSANRPIKTLSLDNARQRLAHYGWRSCALEQACAYEEMVGHRHQPADKMHLPLHWDQGEIAAPNS